MIDLKNTTLSYSGIKAILKSIDHFIYYKTVKSEPTAAMRLGSAFDRYLLEDVVPVIMPEGINLRTNEGKAQKAAIEAEAEKEQREIVSAEDMERLRAMRESVMAHPTARSLLELPGIAQHEEFLDYPVGKGRAPVKLHMKKDWYFDGGMDDPTIVDIKTTKSATTAEIKKSIASLEYYIQAACYIMPDILRNRVPDFSFIFVETDAPHGVQVIEPSPDAIRQGQEEIEFACQRFAAWRDGQIKWTGYSDKRIRVDLPGWVKHKDKNEGGTVGATAPAPKPSTACPPSSREETTADAPATLPPEKQAEPASPHLAPANVGASASSTAPTPEEPRKRRERSDKGKPRGPRIAPPASDTAEPKPSTPEPEAPAAEAKQDTIPKDPRVGKAILDKSSHIRVAVWDNLLERGSKRWQTEQIFKCEIGVSECLIQKPFMDWTQSEIDWFATSHGI